MSINEMNSSELKLILVQYTLDPLNGNKFLVFSEPRSQLSAASQTFLDSR